MIKDHEAPPSNDFHQFLEPKNNSVHISPPDNLILGLINPVTVIRHISMHFNFIFRLSLGFPMTSIRFPHQNLAFISVLPIRATCTVHRLPISSP